MLTLEVLNILIKTNEDQSVFINLKFEIINVLVISFWFIWIPMLWVCDHYVYFYSYSAGIDFSSSEFDVRFWRLKSIAAL